jgi:hypothetical protein
LDPSFDAAPGILRAISSSSSPWILMFPFKSVSISSSTSSSSSLSTLRKSGPSFSSSSSSSSSESISTYCSKLYWSSIFSSPPMLTLMDLLAAPLP